MHQVYLSFFGQIKQSTADCRSLSIILTLVFQIMSHCGMDAKLKLSETAAMSKQSTNIVSQWTKSASQLVMQVLPQQIPACNGHSSEFPPYESSPSQNMIRYGIGCMYSGNVICIY